MPSTVQRYFVAWWNVENLFDAEDARRSEKLRRVVGAELKGWTRKLVDRKIGQLASVIRRMNDGRGPDLLGVCEVENRRVVEALARAIRPKARREYRVVHHESNDRRGIDVAFIYDARRLKPGATFGHVVLKRTATRDLVQVNFTLTEPRQPLVVIGNHWPSRTGGVLETEAYRIVAGETLGYWSQRIHDLRGRDVPLLVMGDFNDEPPSRSLTDHARATRAPGPVLSEKADPHLLNLMWAAMGTGRGTHFSGGAPAMFDQFLASRGLLVGPVQVRVDSVAIHTHGLFKENGLEPVRFGRPAQRDTFHADGSCAWPGARAATADVRPPPHAG